MNIFLNKFCRLCFLLLSLSSCEDRKISLKKNKETPAKQHKKPISSRVIVIQPFNDFNAATATQVHHQLQKINVRVVLRSPMALPSTAYYAARNRYRADSLLHFLKQYGHSDSVVIGMTTKDISVTKGAVTDWGVMGLGYCPGNACIVSTFRLKKANINEQFFKVAIHELGHTQGLPHCKINYCFMRDAEGGNPLNEENDFCNSCKSFLKKKGWLLN